VTTNDAALAAKIRRLRVHGADPKYHHVLVGGNFRLDAMQAALHKHMGQLHDGSCRWNAPTGGMFFWVELPAHMDATALLPKAVAAGMAYVPGATFYPSEARANTLRLSFVTAPPDRIEAGVAALARVLAEEQA